MKNDSPIFAMIATGVLAVGLLAAGSAQSGAQTSSDCLTCHGDASMQDPSGHRIAVDGDKFHGSIHGSLECTNCHADIKEYPHPDKVAPVKCETCHADEAAGLVGSVHADRKSIPARVATETRTRFFPRPIRGRRCIR